HKNLSAGFNISYLFGRLNTAWQLVSDTAAHKFDITADRYTTVSDFTYQLGIQYHKGIQDKYRFVAGLTYTLASDLSASQDYSIRSLGWSGRLSGTDSLYSVKDEKGIIALPWTLRGGVG